MKPEPYLAPPPRELTEYERLVLRVSASGGAHPMPLRGAKDFRTARTLVGLGLGKIEGRTFTANARGVAAVAE